MVLGVGSTSGLFEVPFGFLSMAAELVTRVSRTRPSPSCESPISIFAMMNEEVRGVSLRMLEIWADPAVDYDLKLTDIVSCIHCSKMPGLLPSLMYPDPPLAPP